MFQLSFCSHSGDKTDKSTRYEKQKVSCQCHASQLYEKVEA